MQLAILERFYHKTVYYPAAFQLSLGVFSLLVSHSPSPLSPSFLLFPLPSFQTDQLKGHPLKYNVVILL